MEAAAKFFRCLFRKPTWIPGEIQIEITNRCNLNCPMCPRGNFPDLPREDMPFELFSGLLEKIPQTKKITLTGWGEPLIHPRLGEMLALIRKKLPKAQIQLTTNALLLESELAVDRLNISMESLSGGEDRQGHPGNAGVLKNIARLVEKRGKKKKPRLNLQTALNGDIRNLIDLLRYAKKSGFSLFTLFRLEKALNNKVERPTWEEEYRIWQSLQEEARQMKMPIFFLNQKPGLSLLTHQDSYCIRLDNYAYINVKGGVTPCCNLRDLSGGNLLEQPLAKIYQNSQFKALREQPNHPVCRACDAVFHRYKV